MTALDQAGNRLPFLRDTLVIAVAGPVSLAGGEAFQPLRGGCAGFWLRAGDRPGVASVTVSAGRFRPVTLELSIADATTEPEAERQSVPF